MPRVRREKIVMTETTEPVRNAQASANIGQAGNPDTLTSRIAALKAECELRLKACEAQTTGPWSLYHSFSDKHTGYFDVMAGSNGETMVCDSSWETNAEAIAAQRTERPQELRALVGMLDFAMSLSVSSETDQALFVVSIDIVEIAERALGMEK
jgi:hypothetical protein